MNRKLILLAMLGSAWIAPASAVILSADYEGVTDGELIDQFYDGGFDGAGAGPGDNLGIEFSAARAAISGGVDAFDFANEPSPETVMYYTSETGGQGIVNLAAGFDTGFYFYYSQSAATSTARIYDGEWGTGNLLGVVTLHENWQDGGCMEADYCNWGVASTTFSGVAKSLVLVGAASQVLIDNLTLGAPIPLPAAVWLLGSGLLGFAAIRRRRQPV